MRAFKASSLLTFWILAMVSCTTLPAKFDLKPPLIEDDSIKIEYRIGSKVYYLEITNKTKFEMTIDTARSSIISITGQTRSLDLHPEDSHIPPSSTLIIRSTQAAIFSTNIDAMFSPAYESYHESEELSLRRFQGQKLRLFLPILYSGTEHIYDIELAITGVNSKLSSTILPESVTTSEKDMNDQVASVTNTLVRIYGLEIDSSNGSPWSGSYRINDGNFIPVNSQVAPIIKYIGSQWTASVSILSGAVKVYEVVADDAQGTRMRRVGEGILGNESNPFISLNHLVEKSK